MSSEDITKGIPWFAAISAQLTKSGVCLICVTRENVGSPWLFYEAGAIAHGMQGALICPYLIGVKPSDLASGPLGQYQITTFDKEDTWRLVRDINSRLPHPHHKGLLRRNFDANWASLEQKLGAIEAKAGTPEPATKPKEEKRRDAGATDTESHAVAHAAFGRLRQELSELMTSAKSSRPTGGRASELPAMEKDHADRMKAALQGWLSRARAEASKVSLAGYLAPLAELDATRTDYFELDKFAQRQMAAADAILRKVG